jgi:apolipoprotein N-acyltransferase
MGVTLILSLLAGLLLASAFPLAFAPGEAGWSLPLLAFVAPILLFAAMRRARSAWHAYAAAFACGFVFTYLGAYWISSFGQFAIISLAVYQAALFGLLGVALHLVLRFQSERWNFVLVPAVWVAYEYLHSIGASSFPWLHLGYTQHYNAPVLQLAAIGGVYASTFFVVLTAYTLFHLFFGASPSRPRLRGTGIALIALFAMYAWGLYAYYATQAAEMHLPTLKTAIVQGGISSSDSWDSEVYISRAHQSYVGQTQYLLRTDDPQLVVWPESALPELVYAETVNFTPDVTRLWNEQPDLNLLYCTLVQSQRGLENAAILLEQPYGSPAYYSKTRLVGFGEFVPFGDLVRYLDYPWGSEDLVEGTKLEPLPFDDQRLAVNICYDSVYAAVTRAQVRNGATLVAVVANNSWYPIPSGAAQHAMFDAFRAVENRRSLARATTTGISGFVFPSGKLGKSLAYGNSGTLVEEVPLNSRRSLYTTIGDTFAVLMLIIAVIGTAYRTLVGRGEAMF